MASAVTKDYPGADVSVSVVWIPMLPSDNEQAAREQSGMFSDPRVKQFWDPNRLSGIAYSRDVFPGWLKDAVEALPPNHMLRGALSNRADDPPQERPLWDIALFYNAGAQWNSRPPAATYWMKQIAYFGRMADGTSGLFWQNTFAKEPVPSDWFAEITTGIKNLTGKDPTDG